MIACPIWHKIEDLGNESVGDEVEILGVMYLCADRMAKGLQNTNHFDIYMGRGDDRVEEAREFGKQYLEIKIYEP